MKEDKIIKENESVLDSSVLRIKGNVGFAYEEPKFIKVREFSDIKMKAVAPKAKKKEEVEETTYAADGTVMYYAEEVFDDEDDLYSNEINDRQIAKSKYKSYKEMSELIDEALESRGISGKVGLDLLAAMNFSHFIRFENEPSGEFMNAFFDIFEQEHYMYDMNVAEPADSISHLSNIFSIIERAKANGDKPFFFFIKNVNSADVINFFRPVYYFIDNPVGENYLTGQGRSVSIPNNFFILFSLAEKQVPFDISRRLLRYSATLPIEVVDGAKQRDLLAVSLNMTELTRSLGNAMNEISISEDGWRKIDNLANVIGDVNGYNMHNKIARRNEQFITVLLSCGVEENEALDICLSRNVISEAIITARPQDYVEEHDLYRALEQYFGSGNTPLCEKVVKAYLSLFDKGGNRIED